MTGKPLPPPRLTLPGARQSETFVGVGPDANRARAPQPSRPHVDVATANTGASLLRTIGAIVVAVVVTVGTGAVWGSTRPSYAYVDNGDMVNAATAASVDKYHDARIAGIDVRLERVVTTLEAQARVNDSTEARIRELEARTAHNITATRPK